jgi:hypothetical protein
MAKDAETAKSGANEETNREDEDKVRLEEVSFTTDKRTDLAVAVAFLLTGVFMLVTGRDIKPGTLDDPITARGLPMVTAVLLIIFGVILTVMRLLVWSAFPGNLVPQEGKKDEEGHSASWIRAWAVIFAAWLSMWLLKPLGFLISMPLFLAVLLLINGVRSWGKIIGFSIMYSLITWYVFSQPLGVILPLGPLTLIARSLGLTP